MKSNGQGLVCACAELLSLRLVACLNCGIDDMLVMGSGSEFQSIMVLGKNEYFMQSLLVEMIL